MVKSMHEPFPKNKCEESSFVVSLSREPVAIRSEEKKIFSLESLCG